MSDTVFVSMEEWDVPWWRRCKFLVAELLRQRPDERVLYVEPAVKISRDLKKGRIGVLWQALAGSVPVSSPPGFARVSVLIPIRCLPNSWPFGRWINGWLLRRQVASACRRLKIRRPLLWLNPHYAVHMVGRMGERLVVYDITDEWALTEPQGPVRDLVIRQDRELCGKADLVVVCSEALHASRQATSRRTLLLPNGVDAAHYAEVLRPKQTGESPDPLTAGWVSPVFGYTGTIHFDRIDADLVLALAKAFPHGSVVLVGPSFLAPHEAERLKAAGNVLLPGPVAYAKVPAAMSAFDVCIVPHRESAFTESLNPIKLWEYLAAGKPMVAANVAGFRDYAKLCRIASGSEAFVSACRAALAEALAVSQGDLAALEAADSRRREAANHSWASRVQVLLGELQDVEDKKAQGQPVPAGRSRGEPKLHRQNPPELSRKQVAPGATQRSESLESSKYP